MNYVILATAFPNSMYVFLNSLRDMKIEVCMKRERIIYFEVWDDGYRKRITEETVKNLFPLDRQIKKRPFLSKDNKTFYTVLMRHKRKYKKEFENIVKQKLENHESNKNLQNKPRIRRTKRHTKTFRRTRSSRNK
jgi:hypothetical protein